MYPWNKLIGSAELCSRILDTLPSNVPVASHQGTQDINIVERICLQVQWPHSWPRARRLEETHDITCNFQVPTWAQGRVVICEST